MVRTLLACALLTGRAHAQMCGDADGSGSVTVTDGVQTLRSAAGLSTTCTVARCDVDDSGQVTVTDGVNVLRSAAGLPAVLECSGVRFVDNGDGTVVDHDTGLQWEKKTGTYGQVFNFRDCSRVPCPDPHDVLNLYQWCRDANHDSDCDTPGNPDDGFTQFLAALNTPPCFAGHCDWRLPTVNRDGGTAELETLVDQTTTGCAGLVPCIDPIFGVTAPYIYWSGTPEAGDQNGAWAVSFNIDSLDEFIGVGTDRKRITYHVRAVRTAP